MRTRLAGGEENGRKRMAMLGAVYDAEPRPRHIDDVITPDHGRDSAGDAERNRGPRAFNKWLTSSGIPVIVSAG